MVLIVIWYFRIFQVEDLVQLTWVHHFPAVQLRSLFVLIMVVIKVIFSFCWVQFLVHQSHFCLVEFGFDLESWFLVHVESPVVCSPLSLHMMYSLVHLVIWSFYFEHVSFSFSWVCFTYLVLICVTLSIWDIFHLHHDHLGLTYHGGYWAYWPRIRRST